MNVRLLARAAAHLAVLGLAALPLAACEEDPTAAGTNEPAMIVLDRSVTNQLVNVPFVRIAYVIDQRFNRLPIAVSVTSEKPNVVRVDSARFLPELRETRAFLTALAPDTSTILTFSAAGLTAQMKVVSVRQP
mgnify:CR=1 FL=1